MLKKLRRKFTAVAMMSVFVVLVLILGSVTAANYINVKRTADERIDLIEQNGGTFPLHSDFFGLLMPGGRLSEESPFDTRYFTVIFNADGKPVAINTGSIAAVDRQTALALAVEAVSQGSSAGFREHFRYRVCNYVNGKLVIFVDSSRELASFSSFLRAAVFAGLLGLLLVFLLVVIFSKTAIKPIAESYAKQKRFITDASHEIKTPLAIINSANEVLEIENGESDWTKSIANQVNRLSELTCKLILLSRMDEEGYKPQKLRFNLSDVCLDTAHSFDAVAQANGKQYDVNIQPDVFFDGDEKNITQLLSLLLDNAMKYSDANGRICFSLTTNGKNKVITVENTVTHIKQGNLSVLFERFYRSDESRSSETGGSGIGLSVAKAIVTSHGGRISAYSPDGKKIIFTITL